VTRVVAAAVVLMLLPAVLLAAAIGAAAGDEGIGLVGEGEGGAFGLAAAAQQAGFRGLALWTAVAVGLAESGGNPAATRPNPPTPGCPGGSVDRGPWQLNDCYHPEVPDRCAYQLACAAAATYRISADGTDWTTWTSFTTGAYQAELDTADKAVAALAASRADGGIPPGFGTPGPCGLAPAADYAKHLVTALFGITDIGGCALFAGHIADSDHYPVNGQAHAIDVMVGSDTALGAQVATWAAANAEALHVKYVIFAGQIVDFRDPAPAWHACRDPSSSCSREHFDHVHISFLAI